jgi:hypothetical protein
MRKFNSDVVVLGYFGRKWCQQRETGKLMPNVAQATFESAYPNYFFTVLSGVD